jgi:hypothetical protein
VYGGLSKNISFSKEEAKTTVDVEPSFGLTAGSQNFYYSFLKSFSSNGQSRGKGKGRGNGNSTSTTVTQTAQQQSNQFTLLSTSYELPITVTAHKLKWVTTPTLEMPINLVKTGSGGQGSSSIFYVTTELLFSF